MNLKNQLLIALNKINSKELAETIHSLYLQDLPVSEVNKYIEDFIEFLNQLPDETLESYESELIFEDLNLPKVILQTKDENGRILILTDNKGIIKRILLSRIKPFNHSISIISQIIWQLYEIEWSKKIDLSMPFQKFDINSILSSIPINSIGNIMASLQNTDFNIPTLSKYAIDPIVFDISNTIANSVSTINKQLVETIQNIMSSYKDSIDVINSYFNSIDFDSFIERMKDSEREQLGKYLYYDWYIPISHIEFMSEIPIPESLIETDEMMFEVFDFFYEENNLSFYELIPKTLRTYHEMDQIVTLMELNYFKQVTLFCFERIENLIFEMQLNEEPEIQSNKIQIGTNGLKEYLKVLQNESDYLNNLLSPISDLKNINLFKSFENAETYKNRHGIFPLNRNIFLHGWIDNNLVDKTTAVKAILAYGFFNSLFIMKYNNSKRKYRKGFSTLRGYHRIKRNKLVNNRKQKS